MNGSISLQDAILLLAYRNRSQLGTSVSRCHPGNSETPDLFYQQIFATLLGWPITSRRLDGTGVAPREGRAWRFDPDVIGHTRYAAGSASVARALQRLARRGLINFEGRYLGGATLTNAGAQLARSQLLALTNVDQGSLLTENRMAP
jgi:hypothetical protein